MAKEDHLKFNEAVDRGRRFEEELKSCDPATRSQLLAAWKELIMEELIEALRVTEDPLPLQTVDHNIGLALDYAARKARSADSGAKTRRVPGRQKRA